MYTHNTRLIDLTVGDLLVILKKGMQEQKEIPQYVFGLRGICQLFNVSKKTAQMYKNTFLAPACYQQGRTTMVDVEQAIELYKNRKEKKL